MNVGRNWFNSLTESLLSHRRYIPAGLTLGIGTSLSLAASALVWHSENQRMQVQFHEQADRLNVALQQSINNNLEVLYSLQAFYSASTEVSKQDFKQFVGPTLSRHSAIHSLNWILRVPAAQKAAYEAPLRKLAKKFLSNSWGRPFPALLPFILLTGFRAFLLPKKQLTKPQFE